MTAPKIVLTVLTVAALGTTPAVASAGPQGAGGSCSPYWCGDGNHNEVLVTSARS